MHYLDMKDVYWQARVYWAMRRYPLVDFYICASGYVDVLGELSAKAPE